MKKPKKPKLYKKQLLGMTGKIRRLSSHAGMVTFVFLSADSEEIMENACKMEIGG